MSTATTKERTENYSHLGRPKLDEPVPSRYALKVGAIDVLVVSDGGGLRRDAAERVDNR